MVALLREKDAMTMIKHCVDYRTLLGKRDQLGLDLGARELELLDELDRFFSERAAPEDVPAFAQRDFRRRPVRLAVEFRDADGAARDGRIDNLSGGGVFVSTDAPLPVGSETVLRILDAAAGREWRFGAAVAHAAPAGMGMRFVGIPLEVRLGHRKQPLRPIRRAA